MKKKLRLKRWVHDVIAATIITTMLIAFIIASFKVYGII